MKRVRLLNTVALTALSLSFSLACDDQAGGIDLEPGEDASPSEQSPPDAAPVPSDAQANVDAAGPVASEPVLDSGGPAPDAQTSSEVTPEAGPLPPEIEAGSTTSEPDASVIEAGTATEITEAGAPVDAGEPGPQFGDAGWLDEQSCVYNSPAVPFTWPPPDAGVDAGADAGGPPVGPHVTVQDSAYLGPYLGDHAGFALYIYTADFPGDCNVPPVSTCFEDCLLSWPVFEAGDRELMEGLDANAFGTFVRSDGVQQSTYFGWPLYYYKRDVLPTDTLGQGKGKVWYLAETVLPNLVIMRAPEELEGVRYLADSRGRTLYTYSADEVGTTEHPPWSVCDEACVSDFEPFNVRALRPVTEIEPDDATVFVRADGSQQVAYRGQPLYLSEADGQSGEMNGLALDGFALAIP